MYFDRFTSDPIEAFSYLRVNPCSQTIFNKFAEYVPNYDIRKFIMKMENITELPEDIPLIDIYNNLPEKFSYTELINGIRDYFSKSELALFNTYLFCIYDV